MDFSYTEEQEAVAGLAQQIMADKATQERMTALEKSGKPRFDAELWEELARSGILGTGIGEEFGGAEMGFFELALIIEKLGITVAPVPFIETVVLGALAIETFGSDAMKKDWLPGVVQGDVILTAALYEDLGDPLSPGTRATPDGSDWKLSGSKVCVSAGQLAHRILVPASTEDGRIGIFLVDPKAAGCTITELDTTSGQPEVRLDLEAVGVSRADLLGDLDRGAEILEWIQLRGTSALCSLALGVCEEALRLTAEYTKGREQFGQAIATFQAVGQRAADAYIDTEGIRLTSLQAAWRIAEGLPAESQVAVAKIWAAEAGQRIVHTASHLHGGMGVDKDYPLFRYFTYAKQFELTLGGATAHLMRLGGMIADGTV